MGIGELICWVVALSCLVSVAVADSFMGLDKGQQPAQDASQYDCPTGFIAAKTATGERDSCLLFVDEMSSWYMAKLDCESRGAELADVSHKHLVENINYLRSKFGKENKLYWVDGQKEEHSRSPYAKGSAVTNKCAVLRNARTSRGMKGNTVMFMAKGYYTCTTGNMAGHVCEVNKIPRCPYATVSSSSGCIHFPPPSGAQNSEFAKATWQQAKLKCEHESGFLGQLVTVRTMEDLYDLNALRNMYDRTDMSIWIGADYCCPGLTSFFNIDGSMFNNALWAPGRPQYTPGSCAKLPAGDNSMMVVDANCNDRKFFMCVSQRAAQAPSPY